MSGVIVPVSTVHVSSSTDGVVPSAGASPIPAKVDAEHVSGVIEPASTVHVSSLTDGVVPSAGVHPPPGKRGC